MIWELGPTDEAPGYPISIASGSVEIEVHHCPLLSVLLTHSRLSEEYKESSAFKDPSATLRSQRHGRPEGALDDKNFFGSGKILNPVAQNLMKHVTRLQIFYDCGEVN